MGDGNVEEGEKFSMFCELTDDLIEEILAWLPAKYILRFSSVCKQWNTLFSSAKFFTTLWGEAPPNKKPLLVVGVVEYNQLDCFAYSPFTRSWKTFCLSFSYLEGAPSRPSEFSPLGSATGLFLIHCMGTYSIHVCNPLTGKCFMLPPIGFIEYFMTGEMGIVQEGGNGYKVVVVHFSVEYQQNIVVIYDSAEKVWTMAGVLPRNVSLYSEINSSPVGMVFCEGFFYCLTVGFQSEDSILGFNMREGTSIFVPWPQNINDGLDYYPQLVACGSRIVLVVGIETEDGVGEVVMWEFDKDVVTNWKEVGRMPAIEGEIWTRFECTVMGDSVYFKRHMGKEMVVYSLSQNSWTSLPSCPVPRVLHFMPLNVFEPRPYMKVD